MTHRIATIISTVFEPFLLIPISAVSYLLHIGLSGPKILTWLLYFTVPVLLYRLSALRRGIDWDIKDRVKRKKPFLLLTVFLLLSILLVYFFEPSMIGLMMLMFTWTLGFSFITVFWTKISGHVGGDSLAVGLLLSIYGIWLWPLLIIIPFVAWSRIVRRDHTVVQVIAGALYSFIVLITFHLSLIF